MTLRLLFLGAAMGGFLSSSAGEWRVAYDGYGKAHLQGERGLVLSPKASTQLNETHAALAISKETERHPVQNFTIRFRYKVNEQLRKPASTVQLWETLWLFFNYRTEGTAKKTNYLLLKENGIEIGKAWGEIDQKFLYTAEEPRLKKMNQWHELRVTKRDHHLTIQIDRQPASEVQISREQSLYTEPGAIGLYSEDAHVSIEDIHYEPLSH